MRCILLAFTVLFAASLNAQALVQQKQQPGSAFGEATLSPDGSWMAVSDTPGSTVHIWDTATGKQIATLKGQVLKVMVMVPSHDGKRLFTATTTEVRVWEVTTGRQLQRIPAVPDWFHGKITLSGDQKWLLSRPDLAPQPLPGGRNVMATIELWEVATAKQVRTFQIVQPIKRLLTDYVEWLTVGIPRNDEVIGTALSQDGKWVVAGTRRGTVRRWDALTGKEAPPLGQGNLTVRLHPVGLWRDWTLMPIGFSSDGKWLTTQVCLLPAAFPRVMGRGMTEPPYVIRVWEVATQKARHEIDDTPFYDRTLSDDGKWLLTGSGKTTVRIWDIETGRQVRAFAGHKGPVKDCAISTDKKLLATYDETGTARLWDVPSGRQLRAIEVRTPADRQRWPSASFHVCFSGDLRFLATWTPSRLTLWNLQKGQSIRSLERQVDW